MISEYRPIHALSHLCRLSVFRLIAVFGMKGTYLYLQKSLQKLENTAQIRQLKTVVAQAKTLIKEKSEVK